MKPVASLALMLVLCLLAGTVSASQDDRIAVSHFRITGNTVFSADELHVLVADGEGKRLNLQEIEALAARVTAFYRTRGYILARAYIPAQEIVEGVVAIAVLEGRISAVEVEGARHYAADYLKRYVEPAAERPVFEVGRHERGLLLLNDLPGLTVRSTLRPGEEPGTTEVVLDVENDRLITGTLEVNNYGSALTSRERLLVSANLNNPLGIGDVLSIRGMVSRIADELWYARGSYTVPLGTAGTKVGVAYTHVGATVGGAFTELGINSAGEVFSVYATHPFIRSRALSIYGQMGFDAKNSSTIVLGEQISEDRVRLASVGGVLQSIDRFRGISNVSLTLSQGIGDFLGGLRGDHDPHASREGAGGTFTKLNADVSRLQQIVGPTSFFARAQGQWADSRLVSPEKFIDGGQGTVRGYPVGEIAGDYGYSLTGEFRWAAPGFSSRPAFAGKTWGEVLEAFAFVDHGGIEIIKPAVGEKRTRTLTGAGFGVRFGLPDNFQIKLEYAHPVGQKPSDGLDNVVYFLAVKSF